MKNTIYLVKEKENIGFIMLTGVLKGTSFKASNGHKIDTRFLTKDEKAFSNDFSAKIHADMLNNFNRV